MFGNLGFPKRSKGLAMGKVIVVDHPLVQHKLGILRSKDTSSKDFRELTCEIASLMCYEATRDFALEDIEIETPICKTTAKRLAGGGPAVVAILRAGMGMVNGVQAMIPSADVGVIGLYRDEETFEPHEYYCKLPRDIASREVLVVDPMLATGGSAVAAFDMLGARGIERMRFICMIAAPEGIERLQAAHPDIDIYVAAIDDHLNENAYIVPGLGDAGDRIFGTV